MKRVIALLFAVMIASLCVLPAFAAESTEPGYIYFAVPTQGSVAWKNFSTVYCHMWSKAGGDIYGWQDKNERCEDMGNGYYRYDLSGIDFDPEGEYSLIFSNENGMQTYNLNITSSCLGDIAYCDGDSTANPVDGEKSCAIARWTNTASVHPAIEVDSNGHTINVDEIDPENAETLWGTNEGNSYELVQLITEDNAEETEAADDAVAVAPEEDNADGINTTAATVLIINISAAAVCAVVILVVVLAKRNKK